MKGVVAALIAVIACAALLQQPVHAIAPGTNWAVLVAGSNTWSNYRHQVCVGV